MVRFLIFPPPVFCCLVSCWALPVKVPNTQYYDKWDSFPDHPGYKPFISHLNFRNLSDHIIDQTTEWFDPARVKLGDLVYINVWYLDWFSRTVHDQIQNPYILISGDVGGWLPLPTISKKFLYDPKLAAWFCRNMVFSYHPKFFQIPMGQDFSLFDPQDLQVRDILLNAIANGEEQKEHLLYMNFYPRPFGNRDLLVQLFQDQPYCFSRNRSSESYRASNHHTYFHDLARSRFTLSPLGLEIDCVRTWEALVLNSIPIVEHTFLDPLYEELPVLIVDDWDQIDPPFLERKYQELKHLKNEKAYFQYWENLICHTQDKVRGYDLSFAQLEETAFNQRDLQDLKPLLAGYQTLVYKGSLTAIRPLQIAGFYEFLSSVFVYDPWLDAETFASFDRYLKDSRLLKGKEKITVMDIPYILDGPQITFNQLLIQIQHPYALFLDLTYYRNSLMTDFTVEFQKPRHLLKRDLLNLYHQLPIFSLLIGNSAQNPQVKNALSFFAQQAHVQIEYVGSFWHVTKRPFMDSSCD